jgi:hypothetical protein
LQQQQQEGTAMHQAYSAPQQQQQQQVPYSNSGGWVSSEPSQLVAGGVPPAAAPAVDHGVDPAFDQARSSLTAEKLTTLLLYLDSVEAAADAEATSSRAGLSR